ncbi:MAG TPA: hypothetical protein VHZ32_09755 [Rhizomicrobium sp.]|nr:hypothetical protein [Rhizomicrobium sp.]
MRKLGIMAAAALLLLSACGKDTSDDKKPEAKEDADTPGVTLKAEEMQSLGLTVQPAVAAQYQGQVSGYGVVTALDAIAQADSDFVTAQATAAQSAAAAARARSLATGEDAAISREQLEVAQSKAAADQAALVLARRKSEAAFGLNSPFRDPAGRARAMRELGSGSAVLVRVTFPAAGGAAPARLIISRMGADAKSWTSTTIWDAPADPSVPGRSFYAMVRGSDLAQNERVTAAIPSGAAQSGVKIPANAVVFGESEAWVYVQTAARTFLRTKVATDRPLNTGEGGGYFVTGIKPGDKIVVDGAGLLLAHEVNPSTAAED